MQLTLRVLCPGCHGRGYVPHSLSLRPCRQCQGTGGTEHTLTGAAAVRVRLLLAGHQCGEFCQPRKEKA